MKSRNLIRTGLPIQGLVAFARTLSTQTPMGSFGACGAAMHPGEGSA